MYSPSSHHGLEVEWISPMEGVEGSKRPWRFLNVSGINVVELGGGQFGALGLKAQDLLYSFGGMKDFWAENWEGVQG